MIILPLPPQCALHMGAQSLRERAEIADSLSRIRRSRGELRAAEAYAAEAQDLREVATYLDGLSRGGA